MATLVITKVYLLWSSSKGGKWLKDVFFNKERAEEYCNDLNEWAKTRDLKTKFRIEEKASSDYIISDEKWEK